MQQFGTLGLRVLLLPPAGFQAKRSEGSSQRSGRTADEVVYKRRVDFVKVVYPKIGVGR